MFECVGVSGGVDVDKFADVGGVSGVVMFVEAVVGAGVGCLWSHSVVLSSV